MSLDVNRLANAKSKGKRPYFMRVPEAERVLNVVLALAQETAVLHERMDTLERLLEAKGLLARAEIDAFGPSIEVVNQRSAWSQAYLSRLFRVFEQDCEALRETPEQAATVDELAQT